MCQFRLEGERKGDNKGKSRSNEKNLYLIHKVAIEFQSDYNAMISPSIYDSQVQAPP